MKEKKKYSVSVIRDTRSKKGDDAEAPLKLLVNISGDRFRVGIGLTATATDFSSALKVKGGTEQTKQLRSKLHDLVQKAEAVLDSLPNPNKQAFIRFFKSDANLSRSKDDVTPWFEEYINTLTEKGSIKYAYCMTLSLRSFKKYRDPIHFGDITEQWLRGYEKFMVDAGNSITTVQIYTKNMRTVYNKCVKDCIISPKNTPFKHYKIGSSVRSVNALKEDEVKKIFEYKGITAAERRAQAYWKFSYLSAMNFKDLSYLRVKNIKADNMLMWIREKTKSTNRVSGKQVRVYLHAEMLKVIAEYGNKTTDPEAYLFPILNDCKGAKECEEHREGVQRYINDNLKRIGKKLGFKIPLILNLARHSFSTNLKTQGVSVAIIGEMLGHSSTSTTQSYLHRLPDKNYKQVSDSLVPFLNQ